MKKIFSALLVSTSLFGATMAIAANAPGQLTSVKPGADSSIHSDPNDQGHWRTNSETGEKTWVSGNDDQSEVNEALCGTPLLAMINHCS